MHYEFISYPKSGRTWIRYALSTIGIADQISFHHDGFEYNDASCPTLDFDIEKRRQRLSNSDLKTIYLSRTPQDVMVSLYFQITGRFKDIFAYQGTISEFIHDDYFGAQNLARFREIWD